jgi:hypothetical protein
VADVEWQLLDGGRRFAGFVAIEPSRTTRGSRNKECHALKVLRSPRANCYGQELHGVTHRGFAACDENETARSMSRSISSAALIVKRCAVNPGRGEM